MASNRLWCDSYSANDADEHPKGFVNNAVAEVENVGSNDIGVTIWYANHFEPIPCSLFGPGVIGGAT